MDSTERQPERPADAERNAATPATPLVDPEVGRNLMAEWHREQLRRHERYVLTAVAVLACLGAAVACVVKRRSLRWGLLGLLLLLAVGFVLYESGRVF